MNKTHIVTDVFGDPGLGVEMVRPGAVTVTAEDTVILSGASKSDIVISAFSFASQLDAGSVTITGKTVNLSNGTIDANMTDGGIATPANAGAIEIRGNNINLTGFQLTTTANNIPENIGSGGIILLRGNENHHADSIRFRPRR